MESREKLAIELFAKIYREARMNGRINGRAASRTESQSRKGVEYFLEATNLKEDNPALVGTEMDLIKLFGGLRAFSGDVDRKNLWDILQGQEIEGEKRVLYFERNKDHLYAGYKNFN